VEDMADEIRDARTLFKASETIVQGLEEIVVFLDEGTMEYSKCHNDMIQPPYDPQTFTARMGDLKMSWLATFLTKENNEIPHYGVGVQKSKVVIRREIYSWERG
jgi:hypothetical protein